jgi:hypothetical protein
MTRRNKIALLAASLVVVLVAVALVIGTRRVRSSRLDSYLCEHCASQRHVVSRWWLGIPLAGSDTTAGTLLSQKMAEGKITECRHRWVSTYFDFHGTRGMGHGGIKCSFAVRYLTQDENGAAGLMKFALATDRPPRAVWSTLFGHLARMPRGEPCDFDEWVFEGNVGDSDSVVIWLREHFDSLQNRVTR